MKKKLKLENIKVNSFITEMNDTKKQTIQKQTHVQFQNENNLGNQELFNEKLKRLKLK